MSRMVYTGIAPETTDVFVYRCAVGHERILTKRDGTLSETRRCAQCDYESAGKNQVRHVLAKVAP